MLLSTWCSEHLHLPSFSLIHSCLWWHLLNQQIELILDKVRCGNPHGLSPAGVLQSERASTMLDICPLYPRSLRVLPIGSYEGLLEFGIDWMTVNSILIMLLLILSWFLHSLKNIVPKSYRSSFVSFSTLYCTYIHIYIFSYHFNLLRWKEQ